MRFSKVVIESMVRAAAAGLGLEIRRRESIRPILNGAASILGSFPPREHWYSVGRREDYFIHEGYRHRLEPIYFDARNEEHQWQLEVYKFAREICTRNGLQVVCDIGCGSGFKLLKYFGDLTTIGIDVPQTCQFLLKRWPGRVWMESDFLSVPAAKVDMVIAADMVEHLPDPDRLLQYVRLLNPAYAVFSTPDRNLLRNGTHDGPPENPAHLREWSFAEFGRYVSEFFEIEEHFISFAAQATQCVLCKPR